MNPAGSYNAYAQVDLSATVGTASPVKLIQMLYDGALKAIRVGQEQLKQGNISAKVESISKAIAIIEELNASLNPEVEGELSEKLASLYDYIIRRLVHANVNNDLAPLQEVEKLLSGIRDAWAQIANLPEEALQSAMAGSK